MRAFIHFSTALSLVALPLLLFVSNGSAQSDMPFGMAVVDVTFSSKCSMTDRTYASLDPTSEIVDEQTRECPAGTVIWSTAVDTKQEALDLEGTFVPLSGDIDADSQALSTAKLQLLPSDSQSYALEQTAATGCRDRNQSKAVVYYANEPGVQVYTTVFYYQKSTCASGISRSQARLSWDADLYWRFAEYFAPYQGHARSRRECWRT